MTERIGIIGGTGLYDMEGLEREEEVSPSTPFGSPSGPISLARLADVPLAFIARHGPGHRYMPSEVPFAANIYALKELDVRTVVAVSAVGSLRETIRPRDFVVPDQLFDRTKGVRRQTFFGTGAVAHVGFACPFCGNVRRVVAESARESGATVHPDGTYVCMEGPMFSTRAESEQYRRMGMDVIGMTAVPEAKLAREAGICYGLLAMTTDYDVWHSTEEEVSVEKIVENLMHNVELAKRTLGSAVRKLGAEDRRECSCREGVESCFITSPEARDPERMKELEVVVRR